jgi:hypothetical protein
MEAAMAGTRYRVLLSKTDRARLTELISAGAAPVGAPFHARIPLKAVELEIVDGIAPSSVRASLK